jgi:hypothetical protein
VSCEGFCVEEVGSVRKRIGDGQRVQKRAPSAKGESFAELLSIIRR